MGMCFKTSSSMLKCLGCWCSVLAVDCWVLAVFVACPLLAVGCGLVGVEC